MTMDWHSSVRTRYKILDINEAQSEDERIATWYMIPWIINIQRHLHSERETYS